MSEELVNTWKPRKPIILHLKSGSTCEVQKPGPELALKTGHLHRRLRALRAVSVDEKGRRLADLDDAEKEEAAAQALEDAGEGAQNASLQIMRVTVVACVRCPKLYLDPKPGQLGVDDIPNEDFLEIWQWWSDGCQDPNEVEEVTAEEADRFPAEQAAGVGAGDSGGDVRAEAEPVDRAA